MPEPVTFDPEKTRKTIFEALLDARDAFSNKRIALEDADRQPLSYGRLIMASLILGEKLRRISRASETIALLLPNAQGTVVTLFGLAAYGRVPAILNFTAGLANLRSALETAQVRTLVTSRRFISGAELGDVLEGLNGHPVTQPSGETLPVHVVYLEDVRKDVSRFDKLAGALKGLRARAQAARARVSPDDAAVVLFTSGSEGHPKGVVLSHRNLVANAMQVLAHDGGGVLTPQDTVLNPLPMFHSYGLSAGTLVGLFSGMKVVLYPSPLHYKQIPKLARETGATILFGTDTFLRAYTRAAAPEDFAGVRLVIAGAERVRDETHDAWARYGTTVLEGYGATECAPVIAVNGPNDNRRGTVGRFLPGIEARLEPVEGIKQGGRLFVRGPNVMRGYLFAENPGQLVPPLENWHDTGDIVAIDEDGFVTIRGRAKRFAKLGGEMISLGAVETLVAGVWPDANHVVVSMPDPRKGEQLILVTDKPGADREPIHEYARAEGYPELWVPRAILSVTEIPVLASGKVNYPAVQQLVRDMRTMM